MRKIIDYILTKYFSEFIIGLFQFLGTMLFAYINITIIDAKADVSNQAQKIFLSFVDYSLSLFICISYGRQMSGGVYNPANTIFRLFRRTDRYPIKNGMIYLIAQMLGGIAGAFLAYLVRNVDRAPITQVLPAHTQVTKFVTQVLGSFILCFMGQYAVQKKMTFIEHNRQFYVYLPLIFMIARTYSNKSNGLNPALGLGFELVYCYQSGKWEVMKMSYILIIGPLVGALLAVFVFQFGFRPLFPVKPSEVQLRNSTQQKRVSIQLAKMNRRWDLNEIIAIEPSPAIGDQYQFAQIVDSDYDDEIDSVQEDQPQQNNS